MQAEIEELNAKEAAAADRTVQEAIAAAQELERTGGSRPSSLRLPEQQRGIGTGAAGATDAGPQVDAAVVEREGPGGTPDGDQLR